MTKDWKTFLLMGLWPLVVGAAWFVVEIILRLLARPGVQLSVILYYVGSWMAVVALSALMFAGLVGLIVEYRRGGLITPASYWSYASEYYTRFLLLGITQGVCIAIGALVLQVLAAIPVVGVVLYFAVLAWYYATIVIYLGLYPGYRIVAQGCGMMDAVQTGFQAMIVNWRETAITGIIGGALGGCAWFFVAVTKVGVILLPFLLPFVIHYFLERYETIVRPALH